MIRLIVNGVPFTDFLTAECTVSIVEMANDFSFTVTAVDLFPPFKLDDSVEVWIDGIKKITANIDEIGGSESEGSHTITYSGRDKTSGLIDSNIIGFDDVRGDITLKKVVELILNNIGLDLVVVDSLNPAPFNAAEDVIDNKDGVSALAMTMEYGRKRQALISSDENGNIRIQDSTPTESGETLQRVKHGLNNMIDETWILANSELFHTIIHKGQISPRTLNLAGTTDVGLAENQIGITVDDNVRKGRQKIIVEGKSYSSSELKNRSEWTRQLFKAKATTFSCSVIGHSKAGGGLWEPNSLVLINSDVADISRKMLLDTVTFSEGEDQPTITRLDFVERDVYTIVEPKKTTSIGNQNNVYR